MPVIQVRPRCKILTDKIVICLGSNWGSQLENCGDVNVTCTAAAVGITTVKRHDLCNVSIFLSTYCL